MRPLKPLFLLVLSLSVVIGCQTDRERLNIGDREKVDVPDGLFPDGSGRPTVGRGYAVAKVSRKFGPEKDKLTEDPALMFEMLALFEWLINDLRHFDNSIPAWKLRDLLDVRNDLRDVLNLPRDMPPNDAINRYYSMSKFMALTMDSSSQNVNEPEEISARREIIGKYKGKITALMKRIARRENQETAKQSEEKEK